MTGFFDAFVADVILDCVNGQTGPMDWTETEQAETAADPDEGPREVVANHFNPEAA